MCTIVLEVPEHNVGLCIARDQCLEPSYPGERVLSVFYLLTDTFDLVAPFPLLFLSVLRPFQDVLSVALIIVYC